MKEIYQICDRISILADGKNVVTADASEITMEQLIHGITGKNVDKFEWQERQTPVGERIVLHASGIKTNNRVENVKIIISELRKGPIDPTRMTSVLPSQLTLLGAPTFGEGENVTQVTLNFSSHFNTIHA